jgi:hypothetical protein
MGYSPRPVLEVSTPHFANIGRKVMRSKLPVLKLAVIGSAMTFLSGACFAATLAISGVTADATVAAVADDAQLDEIAEANDIDHGAKEDVGVGAQDDVNNEVTNGTDVGSDVKSSAADAMEGQQDAIEATQEHAEPGGLTGNSGPSG